MSTPACNSSRVSGCEYRAWADQRIAVLERALLVIKAENDRAKREFTNTSNKVIELAIAAAIAGAGKDLDHELIGAISRDIDDAKIDASMLIRLTPTRTKD